MRSILLLSLLALVACDSASVESPLEVGPGEYRLDLEGDLASQASGPARYTLNPDRLSVRDLEGASVPWAEVSFGTQGREVGVLTLSASDDRPVPLEPGTYGLDRSSGQFRLRFPIRDRVFSPYEGTITVERATTTEIVGSFDVKLSTGVGIFGDQPSLLSEGRGRFHAVLE